MTEVIIYTLLVAGEQQKASLEKAVDIAQEKAIFFNMMVDIAEKEFKIPIRKKSLPGQSTSTRAKESGQ